jgi:hypothetical protein
MVISNNSIRYISVPANHAENVKMSLGRLNKDSAQVFIAQIVKNNQSTNKNIKILRFPDKYF